MGLKIVCISDTHNRHEKIVIPECDILICAGDFTSTGTYHEVVSFAKWLELQPAKNKLVVPGNHELQLFYQLAWGSKLWFTENCPSGTLLVNESITVEGIKFYFSPITRYFNNWAWNEFSAGLKRAWSLIPDDTQFLVTHGQPYGINDIVEGQPGIHLGDEILLERIQDLKFLKNYVGGHLHTGTRYTHKDGVDFYNVSILNEEYLVTYPVTVIEIE